MPQHRLYDRLQQAHEHLLSALLEGPTVLDTFSKTWVQLKTEFDDEVRLNRVDEETIAMAHGIASIVSTLAGSFLNLTVAAHERQSTLIKRLVSILENTDLRAAAAAASSRLPHISHSASLPSLPAAYAWLVQNIHDPYPSTAVRENLAAASGVTVEFITSWFQFARERIGWTTLARDQFKGSRSAIVDAARRAFVQPDSNRPLSLELECAFSAVKQNLESLFPIESRVVADHGHQEISSTQVDDGTAAPHKIKEEVEDGQGVSEFVVVKDRETISEARPSPTSLCTLQFADEGEEDEEDTTPPPPIAGSKRRAESMSEIDQLQSEQPMKRRKLNLSPVCTQRSSPVPLPAVAISCGAARPSEATIPKASSDLSSTISPLKNLSNSLPSDHSTASQPIATSPLIGCTPSKNLSTSLPSDHPAASKPIATSSLIGRKRRLSDASYDVAPKRPRNVHSGSRIQAVSDPIPRDTNESVSDPVLFENWYQAITSTTPSPSFSGRSDTTSPATTCLSTPPTDVSFGELPKFQQDFVPPGQQCDLSDEEFQAMVASGCDMSLTHIPEDQDFLNALSSLDDNFFSLPLPASSSPSFKDNPSAETGPSPPNPGASAVPSFSPTSFPEASLLSMSPLGGTLHNLTSLDDFTGFVGPGIERMDSAQLNALFRTTYPNYF